MLNAQIGPFARALPASVYTDPAVFEAEKDRILYCTWQYAGHCSRLRKPGDYFCFTVADQHLFCILGRDQQPRAFFNVCQHRAHHLMTGTGRRSVIVCPYHAWSYDLAGRLVKAPNQGRATGFDPKEIRLTEVAVENFCGFLFVNMDPGARPMTEEFPGVAEGLRAFVPHIDSISEHSVIEVPEACNWKLSVENYSECYHCTLNHPTFSTGVIDPGRYDIQPVGEGIRCLRHHTVRAGEVAHPHPADPELPHAGEYSSWFLWPAFSFQVYPGGLLNTYCWRMTAVDRCTVLRGWYLIPGTDEAVIDRMARQDRDTTVAEDIRLVESQQRGMMNRGYRPGPLMLDAGGGVNSEHSLSALYAWYHDAMAGTPAER